jgi:hypothetical protein
VIGEVSTVIRESRFRPLFGIRVGDKSDRSVRSTKLAEKAKRLRQMLEVAEAISISRPAFVHVRGAPGMRKSLAGASLMRTIGVPGRDGGIGRAARRQLHRAPPYPGDRWFESFSLQRGVYLCGSRGATTRRILSLLL